MNGGNDAFEAACNRLSNEILPGVEAKVVLKVNNLEPIPSSVDLRISTEIEHRATIDAACVQWSYDRLFPKMSPYLATFVWDRVVISASLARTLHNAGFRVPGKSESEILAWLLVEFWKVYGVELWKSLGCRSM
jgi:hypothetical protein